MSTTKVERAFGISADQRIQDLNVLDIFRGISQLEAEGYCDAHGAPITMVIGSTRCGKSTTLNLLLGNSLVAKKEGVGLSEKTVLVKKNADPDNVYPVIGTKTTSETTIPTKYELGGMQLWDCPGFGDTRGPQQEIINAWFVNRLFTTASEVKLVNLCAATSFADHNITEFTNYIKQIQDVFGREHVNKIKPLLVFTKTQSKHSADEYKKRCIELIEEHFPRDKEVQDFFRNAEVTKIDAIQAVGTELTQDSIPELIAKYSELPHQSMHPYVGVDDSAKVFLHQSIVDVSRAATENMVSAYKKAYESTLKLKLDSLYKTSCVERDLPTALAQFEKAKKDSAEDAKNDPVICRELATLNEITDFVLKIIPENNSILELVKTSVTGCQYYNFTVMNYEAETKFLEYLMANSSKITAKDKYHEAWDHEFKQLVDKKPGIADLKGRLEEIYEKSIEVNVNLIAAKERGDMAAQEEVTRKYQKELQAAQERFKKDAERAAKEIEDAQNGWWDFIPIVGPLITKMIIGQIDGPEALQKITMSGVEAMLDKSFSDYLGEHQELFGNLTDYFDYGHEHA